MPESYSIIGHTLVGANKVLENYLARTNLLAKSAIAKLRLL